MTPLHATQNLAPISIVPRSHPTRHPVAHSHHPIFADNVERCELRSDDSPQAHCLSVSHGGSQVHFGLARAGIPVFGGGWESRLMVDGSEVRNHDRWTSICSEINDQAAYLELQSNWESGFHVERQIFLARQDGFAFLADAVVGPRECRGEYTMRLPLAAQTEWKSAVESHDGQIHVGSRRMATVLPLGLPEWRAEPGGSLVAVDGRLELTLPFRGRRSHAALFVDLDPRRLKRPVTWRRLTVGESLATVPDEVAVGYRIQVGKSQWLVYRSLAPRGNRSVLGQNFGAEFVVARFPPDGIAEKLLEIE